MQREPDKFGVPASISVMISPTRAREGRIEGPSEMLRNFQHVHSTIKVRLKQFHQIPFTTRFPERSFC